MNNTTDIERDPDFLDREEKDLIESMNAAIDAGELKPSSARARAEREAFWKRAVADSEKRKAVTLRLQARDIDRLKALARRKGLPYQTFIASVLHQLANGDLVEAGHGSVDKQ